MSAQRQTVALVARLAPALDPVPVLDIGQMSAQRPAEYLEVSLTRRYGGARRLGNQTGVAGYRLTVRAVSRVAVANVRLSLERARAELEFKPLVVGERTSTGLQFETEDPAAPDDGWFSGLMSFTYTIKESL